MKTALKNNSGFSIIIAMGVVVIIGLTAIYILEYIIPFGKNVKGIENASKSYYQAASGVEQSLWHIGQNSIGSEDARILSSNNIDYGYSVIANGDQVPLSGEGNSEYDNDFNTLSQGNPVQLEIGDDMISDWNAVDFNIRVPDTLGTGTAYSLFGGTDPIINWQISTPSDTLNADGTFITVNEVNSSSIISLSTRNGEDLDGNTERFRDFYNSNCVTGISCILKLSVVSDLVSTTGTDVPYLEYNIDFGLDSVPLRFVQIDTSGKSYGFRKDLSVKIPQLTLGEAFDFTVLQ